jgi:hypothetical protein
MKAKNIYTLCVNIISFPKMMAQEGNVSFYTLLKESGYSEVHDQVTIDTIRKALIEHPDCVNDWIQYSEDQRCHPSWFFRQNGLNYEVGYVSLETDDVPITKYSDRFEACAAFIKHLIEQVRQIP